MVLVQTKLILFIHRNPKLSKQVQETQKQYAYLSVTYRVNDNYVILLRWQNGKLLSKVDGIL